MLHFVNTWFIRVSYTGIYVVTYVYIIYIELLGACQLEYDIYLLLFQAACEMRTV